jgi:hypothetical protein
VTIPTLTKDQVRKLTTEQQEALAYMKIQRMRSRQQLLERACRGMGPAAAILAGLASGLAGLSIAFPRLVPVAITGVIALVTFLVDRIHRRLDALIELLDEEVQKVTETDDDHLT